MAQKMDPIEERLVLRIDPLEKERIKRAADFRGQTMTSFVLRAVRRDVADAEAELAQTEKVAA